MAQATEEQILTKLDQLVRLTTISITRGLKQREQLSLLSGSGLSPKEIAEVLGTTPKTVSKELSILRKANGGRATKALRKGKRSQ